MKVFIKNTQSPGDVLMLTAAVRDLKLAHPDVEIGVRTTAKALWENNPHINHKMRESDADIVISSEYDLINQSNQLPYHFIHGFRMDLEKKLDLTIPATCFHGDIHLSDEEKNWVSQIEETGHKNDYWIIMAGGKYDFTAKWWNPSSYQRVVNKLKTEVKFVQCGSSEHWHPKLSGVIDMIGKTDIRQFVRLMYHAQGVVCPVTFAMHLAAAVPTKGGMPKNRPCVVIAGGREPAQWEAYPHHRYLSTNGSLMCCDDGGCWKSRCQTIDDGDDKNDDLCINPIAINSELSIPKCMDMISAQDVIRSVNQYFIGGSIKPYQIGGGLNRRAIRNSGSVSISAKKDIVLFGIKRAGNHMLLDWIINQHAGRNFFLNDLSHGNIKKTIFNDLKSNRLPSHGNIINGRDASVGGINLFLESYEDVTPSIKYHKSVSSDQKHTIVVIREFRNWICSLYKMFKDKDLNKALEKFIPLWISYAEMYINDRDFTFVLYDKFISSKEYRDSIAGIIGVDFRDDSSLERISSYGWASSFDGNRMDGRASEMDVTNRYKEFEADEWYLKIMYENKYVLEMNERIFG